MKMRFLCSLVVLCFVSFGTLAYALPTPVYSCVGLTCTVTQTLYYTGTTTGGTFGTQTFPNDGVAGNTQNYTAPNGGVGSGSGLGGSSLVSANWEASYTFATYNSLSTGYGLVSAVVHVVDATTGTISASQNSGAGSWYGYTATTTALFSTNINPTFANDFLADGNTDAFSGVNTNNTQNTFTTPAACQANSALTNGAMDTSGDACVYLTNNPSLNSGGYVSISGYTNNAASSTAGGANLPTTTFTTGSGVLYELVTSTGGANGQSQSSSESGAAGSEVQVIYTYQLPGPPPPGGTPEPATLLLLGTGLSFVASRLRRNKSAAK
jgi:hypothetical protein